MALFFGGLASLSYFKEHDPFKEGAALGTLGALRDIQENYRKDHGGYAGSFKDLGLLMGATETPRGMSYRDYSFTLSATRYDANGNVTGYKITARPEPRNFWNKKNYFITEAQFSLHCTSEDRAATESDTHC